MELQTKFSDFKPEELIGKYVLVTIGFTYQNEPTKAIRTIRRVTKTGFNISGKNSEDQPMTLYSFQNGHAKKKRKNFDPSLDHCELLTNAEAQAISMDWSHKKEKQRLANLIANALSNLSLTQLTQIKGIANL